MSKCVICGRDISTVKYLDKKTEQDSCCSKRCYKKLHPKICKGCGKAITNNLNYYGYCSTNCLYEHNPELYYKKIKCLKAEHRPKIKFLRYGLLYEPNTEDEVLFLFSKLHKKLGFKYIKIARQKFPDCIAVTNKGATVRIEFEFNSKQYNHDINGCDYIICWEHDWLECPIKVIALKTVVESKKSIIKTLFDYY